MSDERRGSDHFLQWLKGYWFLVATGLAISGSVIALYFDVQFMPSTINPESLTEFRRVEADRVCDARVHDLYDDIRWCVMRSGNGDVLKCLDK